MNAPRRTLSLALLTLLVGALALSTACATVDLRTDALRESAPPGAQQERGRELLEQLAQAHGGVDAWRAGGLTRITLRDHWPNPIFRAAASPWAENGQLLRATFVTGTDSSRIDFMEGPNEGDAWGLQNWVTYRVPKGGEPEFVKDSDIWFWLPTVEYFFEAPFRLREGQNIAYLGPETLENGRTYERVFITWGGWDISDTIDQYVAWIDAESGRLAYLEYTVRDFGGQMKGTVAYSKYTRIGELLAPMDIRTVGKPGESEVGLHRMEILSVDYAADVPLEYVVPDPSRSAGKSDGGE